MSKSALRLNLSAELDPEKDSLSQSAPFSLSTSKKDLKGSSLFGDETKFLSPIPTTSDKVFFSADTTLDVTNSSTSSNDFFTENRTPCLKYLDKTSPSLSSSTLTSSPISSSPCAPQTVQQYAEKNLLPNTQSGFSSHRSSTNNSSPFPTKSAPNDVFSSQSLTPSTPIAGSIGVFLHSSNPVKTSKYDREGAWDINSSPITSSISWNIHSYNSPIFDDDSALLKNGQNNHLSSHSGQISDSLEEVHEPEAMDSSLNESSCDINLKIKNIHLHSSPISLASSCASPFHNSFLQYPHYPEGGDTDAEAEREPRVTSPTNRTKTSHSVGLVQGGGPYRLPFPSSPPVHFSFGDEDDEFHARFSDLSQIMTPRASSSYGVDGEAEVEVDPDADPDQDSDASYILKKRRVNGEPKVVSESGFLFSASPAFSPAFSLNSSLNSIEGSSPSLAKPTSLLRPHLSHDHVGKARPPPPSRSGLSSLNNSLLLDTLPAPVGSAGISALGGVGVGSAGLSSPFQVNISNSLLFDDDSDFLHGDFGEDSKDGMEYDEEVERLLYTSAPSSYGYYHSSGGMSGSSSAPGPGSPHAQGMTASRSLSMSPTEEKPRTREREREVAISSTSSLYSPEDYNESFIRKNDQVQFFAPESSRVSTYLKKPQLLHSNSLTDTRILYQLDDLDDRPECVEKNSPQTLDDGNSYYIPSGGLSPPREESLGIGIGMGGIGLQEASDVSLQDDLSPYEEEFFPGSGSNSVSPRLPSSLPTSSFASSTASGSASLLPAPASSCDISQLSMQDLDLHAFNENSYHKSHGNTQNNSLLDLSTASTASSTSQSASTSVSMSSLNFSSSFSSSSSISFTKDFVIEGIIGNGTFAEVFLVRSKYEDPIKKKQLSGLNTTFSSLDSNPQSHKRYYAIKKLKNTFKSKKEREFYMNEVRILEFLQSRTTGGTSSLPFSRHLVGLYRCWQERQCLHIQLDLATKGSLLGALNASLIQWSSLWTKIRTKNDNLNIQKSTFPLQKSDFPIINSTFSEFCSSFFVSSSTILRIFLDIAHALLFVHSKGVMHLDIKPVNFVLSSVGRVLLTDFGCACLVDNPDDYDAFEGGDSAYLSLELLRGERGPSTDIFALGLSMYEVLMARWKVSAVLDMWEEGQSLSRGPSPLTLGKVGSRGSSPIPQVISHTHPSPLFQGLSSYLSLPEAEVASLLQSDAQDDFVLLSENVRLNQTRQQQAVLQQFLHQEEMKSASSPLLSSSTSSQSLSLRETPTNFNNISTTSFKTPLPFGSKCESYDDLANLCYPPRVSSASGPSLSISSPSFQSISLAQTQTLTPLVIPASGSSLTPPPMSTPRPHTLPTQFLTPSVSYSMVQNPVSLPVILLPWVPPSGDEWHALRDQSKRPAPPSWLSRPQALVDLIDACLSPSPSERPTAQDLIKILHVLLYPSSAPVEVADTVITRASFPSILSHVPHIPEESDETYQADPLLLKTPDLLESMKEKEKNSLAHQAQIGSQVTFYTPKSSSHTGEFTAYPPPVPMKDYPVACSGSSQSGSVLPYAYQYHTSHEEELHAVTSLFGRSMTPL